MSTTLAALNATDARALTDRIKVGVEAVWELIKQAYIERAWDVLGYSSWDDYCTREFGTSRLRLPREERAEVLPSLRESGMSPNMIASATGLSRRTVNRELESSGWANAHPDATSTGPDGKTYTPPTPKSKPEEPEAITCRDCDGYGCETCVPEDVADALGDDQEQRGSALGALQHQIDQAPQRKSPDKPITKSFDSATYDLKRVVKRVVNLSENDRFKKNKDQIADVNLSDLIRVRDALTSVIQQLEG